MNERARQVFFALVFAAAGLFVALGVCLPMARASRAADSLVPAVVVAALAVCGVGVWLGLRGTRHHARSLVRAPAAERAPDPRGLADAGYRGGPPPRVTSRRTSTRATVLLVIACLSFTSTVLPFAVHLPRWVEAEVVLAAWWMTWAVVLAVLAYRGRPLDETHRLDIRGPFASFPSSTAPSVEPAVAAPARSRWFEWLDLGSAADLEGCLFVVAAALLVGVALLAAWVVVELAAPAVFFLAYLGIARALRRALAASHRGDALRSGLHGAFWATAYVAPLGAVIAIAHALLANR